MIILGIDPGTARMGYGVVEVAKDNKTLKLIETDVLVTRPDLEPEKRLMFLYKSLGSIIKKYIPDVMVIEKLFFTLEVEHEFEHPQEEIDTSSLMIFSSLSTKF